MSALLVAAVVLSILLLAVVYLFWSRRDEAHHGYLPPADQPLHVRLMSRDGGEWR